MGSMTIFNRLGRWVQSRSARGQEWLRQVVGRAIWEGAALGVIFSGVGLMIRLGILRSGWPMRYANRDLPAPMRYAPFAMLPLGVGILLTVPSLACSPGQCSSMADLLEPIGLAVVLVSVVALFLPFAVLKPKWLVESERSGNLSQNLGTRSSGPQLLVSSATVVFIAISIAVAIAMGWLSWSLGTALMVAGLSLLGVTSRLTRPKS
jgi:hypothetical protein